MNEILSTVQVGLLITAVIGSTELVKAVFDSNYRIAVLIVVSALIGGLGACLFVGFTAIVFFSGLAVGLGASGVVTVAKKV